MNMTEWGVNKKRKLYVYKMQTVRCYGNAHNVMLEAFQESLDYVFSFK